MIKNRLFKLGVTALTITSLSLLICGCKNKEFKFEGKIYEDSYNYKNDYGYIYLEQTNKKVAKFYEDIYLKMVEFNHKKQDVDKDMCHGLFYKGSLSTGPYSYDDLYQGYMYLTAFNPQFYWMSYILDENTGSYSLGIARAYAKASERKKYEKKIDAGIKKVDELLKEVEDEYDKIRIISDYIEDNMTYAFDENGKPSDEQWAHSITGFFDRNTGVCESYAKVFKLLCDRYDIGNIPVTSEDHIWNLVEYDESWYVFDLTFDDDNRNTYFGKTEDVYEDGQHDYHKDLYKLPENMANTPLSFGKIELKENGNTICSSHSMDYIFTKLNNGNYEIVLNCNDVSLTNFYFGNMNSNYESLTIKSNQNEMNKLRVYLTDNVTVTKDVTINNINFTADGNSKNIVVDSGTIYLKDVALSSWITIIGDSIVYND